MTIASRGVLRGMQPRRGVDGRASARVGHKHSNNGCKLPVVLLRHDSRESMGPSRYRPGPSAAGRARRRSIGRYSRRPTLVGSETGREGWGSAAQGHHQREDGRPDWDPGHQGEGVSRYLGERLDLAGVRTVATLLSEQPLGRGADQASGGSGVAAARGECLVALERSHRGYEIGLVVKVVQGR
jgi:hypothetical protein